MKRLMLGLVLLTCLQVISAQPLPERSNATVPTAELAEKKIDIEPEQCVTKCYYIMGVLITCYTSCF